MARQSFLSLYLALALLLCPFFDELRDSEMLMRALGHGRSERGASSDCIEKKRCGSDVLQGLYQQMASMHLGSAAAKDDPFGGSAVWGS